MSQQALDLRKSIQIARRHKLLVTCVIALGLAAGTAYAVLNRPTFSSEALVVIPLSSSTAGGAAPDPTAVTATQVVIADSDPVLIGALSAIKPPMSLVDLSKSVEATSLTTSVITITANARTGGQAETIANAVANSYVRYVSGSASPVGRIQARLFQPATTATGRSLASRIIAEGLLGALAGGLIGFIVALALGRSDRRLRERDEMASVLGVPVITAISAERPTDAARWTTLLDSYEPGAVDAWRLRKLLEQISLSDASGSRVGRQVTVTVLSLASDTRSLALGPQLASFAAAVGVPTVLVMGSQQGTAATAMLRAACLAPRSSERSKLLRVVTLDNEEFVKPHAALIVSIVTVDEKEPQLGASIPTALTFLAVTAGAATAEQLARVASVAAESGRYIQGILLVDPDPGDQTTGRIGNLGRSTQRTMPRRSVGVPTESRR
jgi:capsular polysaccharide biosynthesis protein